MQKITPAALDTINIENSVLLYPTETVYGLGCSIYDRESLQKIYQLKGRPSEKKVITLVDSLEMAESLAVITEEERKIFLSGYPITLLLQPRDTAPKELLSEQNLISIRKTTHPVCLALIAELGAPLISTSANISGSPAIAALELLPTTFVESCDIVIDAGILPASKASTIVQIVDGKAAIVREGCVNAAKIAELIANNTA